MLKSSACRAGRDCPDLAKWAKHNNSTTAAWSSRLFYMFLPQTLVDLLSVRVLYKWSLICLPSSVASHLRIKNGICRFQHTITLNTSLEEGLTALAGPDSVMVARGVVVTHRTVARLLGGLHSHAALVTAAGQSLSATLAPII